MHISNVVVLIIAALASGATIPINKRASTKANENEISGIIAPSPNIMGGRKPPSTERSIVATSSGIVAAVPNIMTSLHLPMDPGGRGGKSTSFVEERDVGKYKPGYPPLKEKRDVETATLLPIAILTNPPRAGVSKTELIPSENPRTILSPTSPIIQNTQSGDKITDRNAEPKPPARVTVPLSPVANVLDMMMTSGDEVYKRERPYSPKRLILSPPKKSESLNANQVFSPVANIMGNGSNEKRTVIPESPVANIMREEKVKRVGVARSGVVCCKGREGTASCEAC